MAAETGWPEVRILLMPLARLAQCEDCLLMGTEVAGFVVQGVAIRPGT